jgi:1,4-dihydroxy-2-naphthoyl-CoA hydrolase
MHDELTSIAWTRRHDPPLPADPRPGTRPLQDTVLDVLGIELLQCEPRCVVARMPVPDRHVAPGMLLVLAESVASTAAGLQAGESRRAFGAELDASFVAGAAAGMVVAAATPLLAGDERHTWRIIAIDSVGVHVLEARCTLGVVDAAR